MVDASRKPTVTVPRPENSEDLVACVVRGYNSGAIQDGWIVYFNDLKLPPTDGLVGKLVMARSADGRLMLRTMKRGRKPNTWDLFTATGPAELDVELQWAQEVVWVKPYYSWTADELAKIEALG